MLPVKEFDLKFLSLKDYTEGAKIEGYVGGVFTNKFNSQSLTLYMRQANKKYLCQCLSYGSDLQSKLAYDARYVVLTYKGLKTSGKYKKHTFEVEAKDLPDTPAVHEFIEKIEKHTASLDNNPDTPTQPKVNATSELEDLPF